MTALTPQNADRKWVLQHLEEYAEHWQERLGLTNTRTLVMRAAAYQIRDLEAEVERLRARTHEIQEAADARNADLHSQVERHRQLCREAHDWLGEYRERQGIAWESVYEQFGVVNLMEERDGYGQAAFAVADELRQAREEIERLRAIVDRLPKTADGVPVVPLRSTGVYRITHGGLHIQESCDWSGEHPMFRAGDDGEPTSGRVMLPCGRCYSTREAAEAARNQVRGESLKEG